MMENKHKRGGTAPMKTFIRLIRLVYLKYPVHCIIVVISIIISSLAGVAGSVFLKTLVDDYISPYIGSVNPDFVPLAKALFKMVALFTIGVFSSYIFNRLMVTVTQGTLMGIRNDLFEHMETLPIKFYDTHIHGDLMSIYTNDTDTLRQMISQSMPQLISSSITIVSVIISMVVLSIPLSLVVLVIVGLMIMITKKLAKKSGFYFIKQQKDIGQVNGYIEEMMEGQKVVKVFCHEEETKDDFDKMNDQLYHSAKSANTFANILMPIMGNLGYISFVLVSVVGAFLAVNKVQGFSLGSLAAFLLLTRTFAQPISQISQQFNAIVMAMAGAERIFKLLDEKPEVDEGYVTLVNATIDQEGNISECKERTGIWAWKHPHEKDGTVTYTRLLGDVVFDDVDFGYDDSKLVLHNITLFAKPGQKIAFVGATGAGKTTITNLINRFYDIQDGKIRYDGININKIKKGDLRRSLGIVLQDTHLFTGTVKDNIKYGKFNASDEEVIAAAKLANAHQFIKHLPKGYDTMLSGDGANLSQGQRQLLSIARAAIADPPVLILDEATSSIDTRTETIVQEGMDKLMEGRTVFVIAHRLSTVKNSDVIMVLENGRIIERGNHDDLIEQKGKYYQLYTGAFELS